MSDVKKKLLPTPLRPTPNIFFKINSKRLSFLIFWKIRDCSTCKETFGELVKQSNSFLKHTFIKREQAKAFEKLKSEVNSEKIVMQLDFSENAAILQQNEI